MLEIEKDSLMQNGASLPLYCLRGRLDQMGAGLVKEMADAFFLDHPSKEVGEGEEEAPALSLSLEALEAVDYEGLSALSHLTRLCHQKDRALHLYGCGETLESLLRHLGFGALLSFLPACHTEK